MDHHDNRALFRANSSLPHSELRTHCTRHHQHQHSSSHKPFQGPDCTTQYTILLSLTGAFSIGRACSHSRTLLRLMFSRQMFLFLFLHARKTPPASLLEGSHVGPYQDPPSPPLDLAPSLLPPPPLFPFWVPSSPALTPCSPKCGCADPQRLSDRLCSSKGRH